VSGEVGDWHNLADRTVADLQETGMTLRLNTFVGAGYLGLEMAEENPTERDL
jgi:hypothetical protein